jgi:hypothetical protein
VSKQQDEDQAARPVRDGRTGKFQAGISGNKNGRPKGSITIAAPKNVHLRDQIIAAARKAGLAADPEAEDGIEAFLVALAQKEPKSFSGLLGRCLPIMPTRIALPAVEKTEDLVAATGALVKAIGDGDLAASEAGAIAGVLSAASKAIELNQLAGRLDELERRFSEKGGA